MKLQLCLFGAPRLERNNQRVEIDTRKAQALLAYLALNSGEHSREALATLFWPEQNEAHARSSLRRALWTLRQALATDGLDGDKQTIIFRHPTHLVVDVLQFQSLLVSASNAPNPPLGDPIKNLQAAVALYRADFLAGFTLRDAPVFDEWQFFTAETLRRMLADTLQRLVCWHIGEQAYTEGIKYARRWLALDPLHEPAHRTLMQLYAWSNQSAAALRQYEECKRLLEEELGAPPDEETSQLYTAIHNKRLAPPSVTKVPAQPVNSSASTATPAVTPHNLPARLAPLLGRDLELAELDLLMFDRSERLITITGPGGMGKTVLALAAAARHLAAGRFRDGVFVVSLAGIDSQSDILPTLMNTLSLSPTDNQSTEAALKQQVLAYLQTRQMLLVFDNFEQVPAGGELLVELLEVAPDLHILVTSRERLHLNDEQVYPLTGLECPQTVAYLDAPALALFLRTARRSQPHFQPNTDDLAHLVRICQRVGGMPLALEMAARWVGVLSPAGISSELEVSLDFLATDVRGGSERHRSVRATFDTTWKLLAEDERQSFAQLCVFRGGFTRQAAQQVTGATLKELKTLIDKSLVEYQRTTDRYNIHELLRQYGLEQLTQCGELTSTQQRHAIYFLALAESAEAELRGPQQKVWLDRLEDELDNLRAALSTALQRDPPTALALAVALGPFWRRRFISEGWHWLPAVLSAAPEPTPLRARALMFAGSLARLNGASVQGRTWLEESVSFWRTQHDSDNLGQALRHLGWAYYSLNANQSLACFEESLALFRQLGNQQRMAQCLTDLANLTSEVKADFTQASRYAHESLTLMRKFGDQLGVANALLTMAELAELQGHYEEAARLYSEGVDLFHLLSHKDGIAIGLASLAENAWHRQDYTQACAFGEQALTLLQEADRGQLTVVLVWHHLGLAELGLGHWPRAAECLHKSLHLAHLRGHTKMMARCLAGLAGVAVGTGEWAIAVRWLSIAYAEFDRNVPFLAPADHSAYKQFGAIARAHIGDANFIEEWVRGQTIPLEAAVMDRLGSI